MLVLRAVRRAQLHRLAAATTEPSCAPLPALLEACGLAAPGPGSDACAARPAAPAAASPWLWAQAAGYAKAAKSGGKKGASAAEDAAPASGSGNSQPFSLEETRGLMQRAIEHLQSELSNLRTGRATPGMLDHLRVEVYGERVPLKGCATVTVRDPQLLAITVFDPETLAAVQRAVLESPLGLTPRAEGQEVLVPVPRPTAESLRALAKVCKSEAETARVSLRHARKLAMDTAKALASEDDRRRWEREVQKATDEATAEVERVVAAKEQSIAAHNS